jgi:Polyketide cyclase / dehydrase and lipid transport
MATIKVSNFVGAPIARVFQQFTDIEHGAGRVAGIKRIEMLTTGPVCRGTRWRETRDVIGVPDSAEMEMTSFERNRTYTITHHKAGVQVTTAFWFEPAVGGTKVSIEFELDSAGLPPGLLAPLGWAIEGRVTQMLNHDLGDLKRSIEGEGRWQ